MNNKQDSFILGFFNIESAGGIILMFTTLLAFIFANTSLQSYYVLFLDTSLEIRLGSFFLAKPLLLWINDGLMAVFFFVIGLELKREFIEGELSDKRNIILPGVGAMGGMVVPALIYIYFNAGDSIAFKGWAIPAATDIAFALGVLSLLGSRVPVSMKIFLTSVAIFDDFGAILIIVIFHTAEISLVALMVVAASVIVLALLNKCKVVSKSLYITIGVIMWVATLKSGVHATLAGIVLAMFIPLNVKKGVNHSPLKELEHDLHSVVVFVVLPVFAFANAGINLSGVGVEDLLHNVPLGIALGLFFGKQIGVFGFCWLAIKLKLSRLPRDMSWSSLYGVAALCGIGFTMSLFISSLVFEETGVNLMFDERLGLIIGSLVSGIVGYLVLRVNLTPRKHTKIHENTRTDNSFELNLKESS